MGGRPRGAPVTAFLLFLGPMLAGMGVALLVGAAILYVTILKEPA